MRFQVLVGEHTFINISPNTSHTHTTMAKKKPGELTGNEVTCMKAAAKLLAAIAYRAENPPAPGPSQTEWDNLDNKAYDELVHDYITYHIGLS